VSEGKHYTFRHPARLASRTQITLWTLAGIELVLSAAMLWQYRLLEMMRTGAFGTHEEMMAWANTNDTTINLIQWGLRIVLVIGTVLFFMWVYRANANVNALGAADLDVSPGFAVGAYFIPFANLFVPPYNMHQVWKASLDASHWRDQNGTFLVAFWWSLQLLCGIGGWISILMKSAQGGIPAVQTFSLYMLGYFFVCAVLHVTVAAVVGRITRAQVDQHARVLAVS
jgi:hypothetical protein